MPPAPHTVAYITAGAGGMYCGSCLHDNTLARALARQGFDVQLIPLYTPIRTDEEDVSIDRVFFGGINVYLQQKIPFFRHLPAFLDRFFDQPWLIRWATSHGLQTNARELGNLTVSMLQGTLGHQRKEVRKLCSWLSGSVQPQLVTLSNMLIAGCVPALKRELGVPVLVTLQGDDVFLEDLVEPYKSRAFTELRRLVADIDAFIVNSRYYADFMAGYLGIPAAKMRIVPLGIDTADFREFFTGQRPRRASDGAPTPPPTVGYLARLAPEKGLHVLVDAFIRLRRMPGAERTELRIAGWLGESNRAYADEQFRKLREAGLESAFCYVGEVNRQGKLDFFQQLDVLSVPTTYRDPKGLFVLEALAAGVPVVQPEHGAFPELLARLGGGRLVAPNDPEQLARTLHDLLTDAPLRERLGRQGMTTVHERCHADAMAQSVADVYREFLKTPN